MKEANRVARETLEVTRPSHALSAAVFNVNWKGNVLELEAVLTNSGDYEEVFLGASALQHDSDDSLGRWEYQLCTEPLPVFISPRGKKLLHLTLDWARLERASGVKEAALSIRFHSLIENVRKCTEVEIGSFVRDSSVRRISSLDLLEGAMPCTSPIREQCPSG